MRSHESDLVAIFAMRHGVTIERFTPELASGVYCLEHASNVLDEASHDDIERLVLDPTWGLLRTMVERERAYAAASLVVHASGLIASGEILARSVVEAAVNVLFVLNGDRLQRLYDYLLTYIATERSQNKTWDEAVGRGPAADRALHAAAIARKESALSVSEDFLRRFFDATGRTNLLEARWPSAFERFKDLGKEIAYRTVYAALCSQTHNDAEDLLNEFIIKSVGNKKLIAQWETENIEFSKFSVLIGVQYHLEAVVAYARCFGLKSAYEALANLHALASRLAENSALASGTGQALRLRV